MPGLLNEIAVVWCSLVTGVNSWQFCMEPRFQRAAGAASTTDTDGAPVWERELMVTVLAQACACNSGGFQAKKYSKFCFPCQTSRRLWKSAHASSLNCFAYVLKKQLYLAVEGGRSLPKSWMYLQLACANILSCKMHFGWIGRQDV